MKDKESFLEIENDKLRLENKKMRECLALAAIPLEVLRATEMDGIALCAETKSSILEATDKIRKFLEDLDL